MNVGLDVGLNVVAEAGTGKGTQEENAVTKRKI